MEKGAWVRTIQEQVKRLSEPPFYLKRFQAVGLNPGDNPVIRHLVFSIGN